MTTDKEIPYGYCHCGCGGKTNLSTRNNINRGITKGIPSKFLSGHHLIEKNRSGRRKGNICNKCKINPRYDRITRALCIECYKEVIRKYRLKTKEKMLKFNRLKAIYIANSYIKSQLTKNSSLNSSDISQSIIEVYRLYLKLRRKLRKTQLKGAQYVERVGNPGSPVNPNQGT